MALLPRNLEFSLIFLITLVSAVQSRFCHKPSVRREWNTLSETEQAAWISAVKCFGALPRDGSLTPSVDPTISHIPPVNTSATLYDDFVYVHMDLNVKIHFTGFFLPWHRAYVHAFETVLKDKCGYHGTQPYWNWSLNTEDFFNSKIFDPSPTSGFGGNGDPNNDYQITNGGFSTDFFRAYPVPNNIRRNFTLRPWEHSVLGSPFADHSKPSIDPERLANTTFTKVAVQNLVEGFRGDFEGFQARLEYFQGVHTGIHSTINADMLGTCPRNAGPDCVPGPKWSANDPLFFMHHAMIDKVWYDWQNRRPENFWSFHGGSVQAFESVTSYTEFPNGEAPYLNFSSKVPLDGMFEEPSVFDVMDTTGGKLCYVYE